MSCWCDRLTKLELLSEAEQATASSAEVDGSKYGVWAIPATVDASDGQIDLVKRVGLVRATTRGDEREFRRRVAAWVGRVAADMAAEGSTEAEIAEFRKGGSLFFAKIGVGTKSFAFAGRAATASASRYELYFRPSSDLAIEVQNMMFRGSEMPIIAYWPAADDSSSCFLYYFSAGMVLASPAQFVIPAGLPTAAAPKTVKAPAAVAAVVVDGAATKTATPAVAAAACNLTPGDTSGVHNWEDFVELLTKFEELFEDIAQCVVVQNETQVAIDAMVTPENLAKLSALGVHFPSDGSTDEDKAKHLFTAFDEDFDHDELAAGHTKHKGHGFKGQTKDSKLLQPEFITACAYATPSSGTAVSSGKTYTIDELQRTRNSFEDAFDALAGEGSSSVHVDEVEKQWEDLVTYGLTLPPPEFNVEDMYNEMDNHAQEMGQEEIEIHVFEMYLAFFQNPGALHHE